jgi:hypothetical protein
MSFARRRLALVALLLLTLGASATVPVTGTQRTDGHLPTAPHILGLDAVANGLVLGTSPKGAARGTATSSSKRHARSALLAALGGTLGALALLRRRLRPGGTAASAFLHQLTRTPRAPPGLAPTHS